MPVISTFSGIVVRMYYFDTSQHSAPHIHAQYAEDSAVFSIDNGNVLAGGLPPRQTRLVQAWIEVRRGSLAADWILAANGATLSAIEPI